MSLSHFTKVLTYFVWLKQFEIEKLTNAKLDLVLVDKVKIYMEWVNQFIGCNTETFLNFDDKSLNKLCDKNFTFHHFRVEYQACDATARQDTQLAPVNHKQIDIHT